MPNHDPCLPAVYSMVKLGGVRNYVVGTWSPSDLEACAAMNLPCADLSPWLPEPMNNGPGAGKYMTHDYLVRLGFDLGCLLPYVLLQGTPCGAPCKCRLRRGQAPHAHPPPSHQLGCVVWPLNVRSCRSLAGCGPW